ncbi:MAG: hypothetical protein LBB82_07690 [Treponema sp.]|nr:hypothetical protein [Treponema sp.]
MKLPRLCLLAVFAAPVCIAGAQDAVYDPAPTETSISETESSETESAETEKAFESSGFGFDENDGAFGFDAGNGPALGGGPSFHVNGEARLRFLLYLEEAPAEQDPGNLLSGRINFSVRAGRGEAVVNLKLDTIDTRQPLSIDEAFLRLGFSAVDTEIGLRKLTWGKADSAGPLDVVNPLDYSDLTDITDQLGRKIARPMVRVVYHLGDFTALEGVFIPVFRGHKLDLEGRWMPVELAGLNTIMMLPLIKPHLNFSGVFSSYEDFVENYNKGIRRLDYAQGGLRFTTTLGSSDIGFQYFTGNFFRPALSVQLLDLRIHSAFNRYHQFGADYARVIAGFNARAELALNLTEDMAGDDPKIENPSLLWSLGFDRDLVWGINLNLQGSGSVTLRHDKIKEDSLLDVALSGGAMDCQSGKKMTSTRLTGVLSKKLLRDELEIKTTGMWGIEDRDFHVIPALVWTREALSLELSAGFFGGSREGELGFYRDNRYVKTRLTWKF